MKRKDIEEILHPGSIALIGVSADRTRGATKFMNCLLKLGYEGGIYPINPNLDSVLGIKAYPSLLDIPGTVDHAIVGAPARVAPSIVRDAVKKGLKSLHFYTSGFAEIDAGEGAALQKEVTDIAGGEVRIIGPNCMGIYNPKARIGFDESQVPICGGAAFVSQSGGLAIYFSKHAVQEGNYCSKMVSLGNSSDLKIADFFEYLSEDDETKTISMYIEGLGKGEGRKLLDILATTVRRKPVIIWKGGQSNQGARAAFSHTGAIATDYTLWQAIARQFGAVLVESIEEMHDFIKLHRLSPYPRGMRCGLVSIGGGNSVAYSDVLARYGFTLPEFDKRTHEALLEFISPMGTMLRNPVDLASSGFRANVIEKTLGIVGQDPNIDVVIFVSQLGLTGGGVMGDFKVTLRNQVREIISACRTIDLPVLCNNPIPYDNLAAEELRFYVKDELEKNGIPTFPTFDRTVRALKRYHDYRVFCGGR